MAQMAAFCIGAAGYVFAIGWVVTWVRLAAARLPVDASLTTIDDKVLFAAGLRLVVVMTIVFGAMCAVAYAVHAWTWAKRAPEWHAVVKSGRAKARALKNASASADARDARSGDRFVRVVAGFNVVVLAAALGLAGGRLVKPLIDQAWPGHWWDLLGPWAVITVAVALLLAWVGPLRGGRGIHAVLWAGVAGVVLLSSAPIGLLIVTWAGIATLGRVYGRHRDKPGSKVQFVLSPLPWMLLTIYALVGLAYDAMPPVSFSQTVVNTPNGARVGGFLARTGAGVYLASCTPLADATSTNEAVSLIPAGEVKSMTTGTSAFAVDSGLRPSLPTLALHAFGIDASAPAWIRPDLRARLPTCSGEPLPRPSVGFEAPQLGAGVIAGPAPPGGRANDGETPIGPTTPGIAALARRFQPTVLVTVADRFWPVSVGAVLADIGSGGEPTCLQHLPRTCPPRKPELAVPPKLTELGQQGSTPDDFLEYPAQPALDPDPTGQFNAFLRGQRGRQTPVPPLRHWLADPGLLNPWYSAEVYFYNAGRADPSRWPAPNNGIGGELIALQYWFFYPYNYYPTAATPDLMNDAPIAGDAVNTDLHQGDWEHITVLVDRKTHAPRWLYMARHSNEGQYLPWSSPLLSFDQGHPIVQAALGGHPTYDAHCGGRLRFAHGLGGLVSDWVVCGSGRFAFRAATTPLVDIATTPWACWKGHFGVATKRETSNAKSNEDSVQRAIDSNYLVAGPRSPLWQAENGRLAADQSTQPGGKPPADTGVCAANHNPGVGGKPAGR